MTEEILSIQKFHIFESDTIYLTVVELHSSTRPSVPPVAFLLSDGHPIGRIVETQLGAKGMVNIGAVLKSIGERITLGKHFLPLAHGTLNVRRSSEMYADTRDETLFRFAGRMIGVFYPAVQTEDDEEEEREEEGVDDGEDFESRPELKPTDFAYRPSRQPCETSCETRTDESSKE